MMEGHHRGTCAVRALKSKTGTDEALLCMIITRTCISTGLLRSLYSTKHALRLYAGRVHTIIPSIGTVIELISAH